MHTTHRTTTLPIVEIGHQRRTAFVAALAALSVTLVIAITAVTVTDDSSRSAARSGSATTWVTPQRGPGSNSLSLIDEPLTATPRVTPRGGPGSNSLSLTDA